jgi:hypothetical protein
MNDETSLQESNGGVGKDTQPCGSVLLPLKKQTNVDLLRLLGAVQPNNKAALWQTRGGVVSEKITSGHGTNFEDIADVGQLKSIKKNARRSHRSNAVPVTWKVLIPQ